MPFYRIVIWTRKRQKPFEGIREIENHNITAVHELVRKKAVEHFHFNFLDCEFVHPDHLEVRFVDIELIRDFGALMIFGLDKALRSARITDAGDSTDLIRAISAELK